MATQGMAQPSAKKRSFLLRDIFKLCRSISRVLPRDKAKHHHVHKAKHDTNESKRIDQEPKRSNQNAFKFQVSFFHTQLGFEVSMMFLNGFVICCNVFFARKRRGQVIIRWKVRVFVRFVAIDLTTTPIPISWGARNHYLFQEVVATTRPRPPRPRLIRHCGVYPL